MDTVAFYLNTVAKLCIQRLFGVLMSGAQIIWTRMKNQKSSISFRQGELSHCQWCLFLWALHGP